MIEYFQDFDGLRSGSISKSQFRRGLSSLGLSKLGHHDLIDPQFAVLCKYYENPKAEDKVLWTKFMDDIESGKVYLSCPAILNFLMRSTRPTSQFYGMTAAMTVSTRTLSLSKNLKIDWVLR